MNMVISFKVDVTTLGTTKLSTVITTTHFTHNLVVFNKMKPANTLSELTTRLRLEVQNRQTVRTDRTEGAVRVAGGATESVSALTSATMWTNLQKGRQPRTTLGQASSSPQPKLRLTCGSCQSSFTSKSLRAKLIP